MLLLTCLLALTLGGCNDTQQSQNPAGEKDYPVKLYYASTVYITEGMDEENGELMPPVETTVTAEDGEQYLETLKLLAQTPEDESYSTIISGNTTFHSVKAEDGIAYVDVASENLGDGSLTETLFVDQILYTLISSFDEIDSVQFLLDGEKTDSLMGHIETSSPLTIEEEDK